MRPRTTIGRRIEGVVVCSAVFLVVGLSVVLAGVAATMALSRPETGRLNTHLKSALRSDYSADPRGTRLAPLSERIIEAARQDAEDLEA